MKRGSQSRLILPAEAEQLERAAFELTACDDIRPKPTRGPVELTPVGPAIAPFQLTLSDDAARPAILSRIILRKKEAGEELLAILQACDRLPKDQRSAILGYARMGSLADIQEELQVSSCQLTALLSDAVLAVREDLKAQGYVIPGCE